jgi:hypothetical protein
LDSQNRYECVVLGYIICKLVLICVTAEKRLGKIGMTIVWFIIVVPLVVSKSLKSMGYALQSWIDKESPEAPITSFCWNATFEER